MKTTILFAVILFFTTSCMEEGKIRVQNKLSNVKIESISFEDYGISASLLPGQTSETMVISDYKKKWPKSDKLEFYMVGSGNQVYLVTKEVYTLDYDDDLLIVITDSTVVENPLIN